MTMHNIVFLVYCRIHNGGHTYSFRKIKIILVNCAACKQKPIIKNIALTCTDDMCMAKNLNRIDYTTIVNTKQTPKPTYRCLFLSDIFRKRKKHE